MPGCISQLSIGAFEAGSAFLQAIQLPEGGWSYDRGPFCYGEPTALASLALGNWDGQARAPGMVLGSSASAHSGLSWLEEQKNQAGAVVLPGDPDSPHWSTALAVFAAVRLGRPRGIWHPGVLFLLDWQAIVTEPDPTVPLNTELRGWPWYPESFSWVIPTAHALLALRLAGYGAHIRVAEGEALLLERVCQGGGWNYGNREVLGQMLQPMADTTAWALLALQDCLAAREAVTLGLDVLDREVRHRPSSMSLALAILCFALYRIPADDLVSLLLDRQMDDGSWQHQVHLTALAMLALKAVLGEGNAFALQT